MSHISPIKRFLMFFAVALFILNAGSAMAEDTASLPDPDGKPADMTKPVQVFILMGQSNMLGFGKVNGGDGSLAHAVKEKGLYPYLVDDAGVWTTRQDVRNVFVMDRRGRMQTAQNEWLTITNRNVGPEVGIGHHLGNMIDAPVLILKACIGNRCLGWDLLPPGSERYEHGGKIHAGYKDSYSKVKGPWEKGSEPPKPDAGDWYAGWQYDIDV
ncbi:MAG: sialate O-acetylesterase, partial [Phycisphaeraceae bacterium]